MDIFTSLPDSLDSLTTFASQLQWLTGIAIAHPLWSVVAVLLSIVTLQVLVDLVKRGLQAGLGFMVRLPLGISRWVWTRLSAGTESKQQRVSVLLNRLDQLRAEEATVLAELKGLVSKTAPETAASETTAPETAEENAGKAIAN
ncbi:MAG: hypothetical protein AAGN15_24930 [Cyanobacteria bacterium J06581_3]